ncbi:NAD-dependent epimerase/dehydratase family protein, partial [Brucella melitensis]
YPRDAAQPLTEDALLTGPLEPTNEAYAIAKIAGLKYAQSCARQFGDRFITAMPTNLYGPNDNFDPTSSHVLPALIRRVHEARMRGAEEVCFGAAASPCGNSCMWTTSPMRACISCAFIMASSR